MRLKAVALQNFRGYRNLTRIPIGPETTGIIGCNDVGKSSILEALEIFFNNETVKIDPSDLSVGAQSNLVTISCIFDELPASVVVDETVETTLGQEFLLNADGDLEIVKIYKCQAKVAGPETFIKALHPSAPKVDNLLELKIDQLRGVGNELGVADEVGDHRKSALWRHAIWASIGELRLASRDLDVSKLDSKAKSIFDRIEALFPTYALFKADRESRDADSEAKDPMQLAVKQALDELRPQIAAIESQVTARVVDVADRTLGKLREMDSTLASSLKPTFRDKPKWTFNFSLESDGGIAVNKRGSGVRRLILLNFFRAEAERKAGERSVVYAIEEPETSQHPNNQEMLIRALLALSSRSGTQVLVTTHVPALAGLLPSDSVLFVENTPSGPTVSTASDDVLESVVRTLGVLPQREVAGAKALILVEGEGDVVFLNHSAMALKAAGYLSHSLVEKEIVAIPTGGLGNLNAWVTKRTADQLGRPWAVFIDSDQDGTDSEPFLKNCTLMEGLRASGTKAHMTRKREAENYLLPQVIHVQVNTAASAALGYGEFIDAKPLISQATSVRANKLLETFWPAMTAAHILQADEYTDNSGIARHEIVEVLNDLLSLV